MVISWSLCILYVIFNSKIYWCTKPTISNEGIRLNGWVKLFPPIHTPWNRFKIKSFWRISKLKYVCTREYILNMNYGTSFESAIKINRFLWNLTWGSTGIEPSWFHEIPRYHWQDKSKCTYALSISSLWINHLSFIEHHSRYTFIFARCSTTTLCYVLLLSTHWGREKMVANFLTTFSNVVCGVVEFWLRFNRSLFPRVQLYTHIYESLGLNELHFTFPPPKAPVIFIIQPLPGIYFIVFQCPVLLEKNFTMTELNWLVKIGRHIHI